jgi:hypothetical protein
VKKFDLTEGASYTVAREFTDFDGRVVVAGARLTFVAQSADVATGIYLLSFRERRIRLQEHKNTDLIDQLQQYLQKEARQGEDISCPNCKNPMLRHQVDLFYRAHPVDIDACPSCNLLWFDQSENIRLTPQSVLSLFELLSRTHTSGFMPLSAKTPCPRCAQPLALTHDVQRSTRFTYWRCPSQHGELFTFCQFLLQKNFIRTPSAEDLARLKKTVRQIACTQCGAPIDLMNQSACSHCGSAIAIIDPDGMAKAVHELNARATPEEAAAAQSEAKIRAARILAESEVRYNKRQEKDDDVWDILMDGMSSLKALLTARF